MVMPFRPWPNTRTQRVAKRLRVSALGAVVTYIDNKEFNTAAEQFAKTGRSTYANQMEIALGAAQGFRGIATTMSKKADLQHFNVALVDNMKPGTPGFDALPSSSQGLVLHLLASTVGDIKNIVVDTGEEFGGFGVEFKGIRREAEIDPSGKMTGVARYKKQKRGPLEGQVTREVGEAKPMTIGGRYVGGVKSEVQYAPGMDEEKLKSLYQNYPAGKSAFFRDLLFDKGGITTKLFGPSGAASFKKMRQKARNIDQLVTLYGGGKRRNFVVQLTGLLLKDEDITGNQYKRSSGITEIQIEFSTAFEHKLTRLVLLTLQKGALRALESRDFLKYAQDSGAGLLVLGQDGKMGGLHNLFLEAPHVSTRSIPMATGRVVATPKKRGRQGRRRAQPRGRFISSAQLSAILQQRLVKGMPRRPEPLRPTPRYVTGALARSFQIIVNYRQNLMSYYNTPPVSGYVDQLNENGWMLDETLVEPTIRQITQQLFGRQFRVLRTQ